MRWRCRTINRSSLAGAGDQAITASKDGIKQWNLADGNLLRSFTCAPPTAAAFVSVAARPDSVQRVAANFHDGIFMVPSKRSVGTPFLVSMVPAFTMRGWAASVVWTASRPLPL